MIYIYIYIYNRYLYLYIPCFSGVYYGKSTSIQHIPVGRIEFHSMSRISTPTCAFLQADLSILDECVSLTGTSNGIFTHLGGLSGDKNSTYYMTFTSPVKNSVKGTSTMIRAIKRKADGVEIIIKELYDYGTNNADCITWGLPENVLCAEGTVTMSFTVFMQPGDKLWLDNRSANTLMYGPRQYQYEWMIFMAAFDI